MTTTTIRYTITKTRGVLAGMTIRDQTLTFPSKASANDWVRGVRTNVRNGSLDYTLDEVLFS